MRSKSTATVLSICFGGIGVHKFYLGETNSGRSYLLFCWTFVPLVLGFFDGLRLLAMSQAAFDARYNRRHLYVGGVAAIQQQSTNVVVNVASPSGHSAPPGLPPQTHVPAAVTAPAGGDVAARLGALHDLKIAGALTDAEFTAAKQKLLTTSGTSGS